MVKKEKIRPKQQMLVDRIAAALADLEKGRTQGPYTTAKEAIEALEKGARIHLKKHAK